MKKIYFLGLLLFCACSSDHVFITQNVYFDKVFAENTFTANSGESTTLNDELLFSTRLDTRYRPRENIASYIMPRKINFYQDENKQCFLFSYNQEELINMKINAGHNIGYNIFRPQPRFLVEKDGLKIVSYKEFKRITNSLAPHSFDPSLCKN